MKKHHWAATIAGFAVGLFLMWMVFRSVDAATLWERILGVNSAFLALGLGFTLGAMMFRALRFRAIAGAQQQPLLPFWATLQSTDLIDVLIPLKLGFPLRAMMLTRHIGERVSQTFAVTMIDRLVETAGIFAVVVVTVLAWPTMGALVIPPDTFGTEAPLEISRVLLLTLGGSMCAIVTGGLIGTIALYRYGSWVSGLARRWGSLVSPRWADRIATGMLRFSNRLHLFRTRRHFFEAMILNALFWGCYLASIHAIYLAFSLDPPWYASFMTIGFFMVSFLGPNAPGMVGQYHVAVVLAQVAFLPDADIDTAKAVAVVVHLMHFSVIVTTGLAGILIELRYLEGPALRGMVASSLKRTPQED